MLNATLLIQDVQLLCFTVVFGVLALQRWNDAARRWLWFSFLANAAGAIFDLSADHLPNWVSHGINLEMIPLSYALLNVALVQFERKGGKAIWLSAAILVATAPVLVVWSNDASQFRSFALGDFAIALECVITTVLLVVGRERSTQAPRLLMGGFLAVFVAIELARFVVAFFLHADPDVYSHRLEVTSAVAYIVNTSLLPLAFIWMMHARLESDLLLETVIDPLTRVFNRRGLEQALDRELARFQRYKQDLTVAILDLDHFKKLNDAHGHAAGDGVLLTVADLLSKRLRGTDVVGRLGGEEFVLILPNTDESRTVTVLEYLCWTIREYPFVLSGVQMQVTASFGVTTTRGREAVSGLELLHEADIALYKAKNYGRDQVCFYAPGSADLKFFEPSAGLRSVG